MPTQRIRVIVFLCYIAVLFIANYLSFGSWVPLIGGKGLWFYTGLASILLGSLLVTPFFTKPVDAISYSVVAIIALYSSNLWQDWGILTQCIYVFSFIYACFVLVVSFLAIFTKDSTSDKFRKFSNTCKLITDHLGNQDFLFTPVIIFALLAFHQNFPKEILVISLAWLVIVALKPENRIFRLFEGIKRIWVTRMISIGIGEIAGFQSPGLVLVRQKEQKRIKFGTPLIFKDEHAPLKTGIALDYTGRDEGLLLRAIEFDVPSDTEEKLIQIAAVMPINSVSKFELNSQDVDLFQSVEIFKRREEFVGVVSHETSVDTLYFEVIQEHGLEEGRLVEVSIRGKSVLYQVIDGMTKEEVVYKKNTFGYVRAKAKKIGLWNETDKKFMPVKWLPRANTPVYIKVTDEFVPNKDAIGHFEGTNYTVSVKSMHDLITHNSAILGILGIGKSMLAIELVERIISENIKVICLDLTNQYSEKLDKFYKKKTEEASLKAIQEAGEKDQDKWAENPEQGGSLPNLTQAVLDDLKDFLKPDNDNMLKIYNPSKLFAKKQLSDPRSYQSGGQWQRSASLWTVTPVETTKIVAECVLEICQDQMSDKARVCIVFEEAHSLIPEWATVACDGDKAATNATARAILQGRKYGLGCLLITQRTANVTKTILNQCNTIFAMRTFDDTGKGFLSNYIGSEHANILPTLQERCAVVFGKASSCENPVLLRLNDRDKFLSVFREDAEETNES
ncbi:MAG: DUF87 domain-containing protein [bacterium]|nr:DUF87 domain-containing protein [bacterium]